MSKAKISQYLKYIGVLIIVVYAIQYFAGWEIMNKYYLITSMIIIIISMFLDDKKEGSEKRE